MTDLVVRPARTKKDVQAFVDLPWSIQGDDPCWVPPLKREVHDLLSDKHPFWARAERELFLAERAGRVVGRIAAIKDEAFIEYQKEQAGAWGFFECERNQETADALLNAAERWCLAKGLAFMRGPFSPSTNYEIGMLVEGFGTPPTIMMPYNPEWYPELMDGAGLVKEKDVFSYLFERGRYTPAEWVPKAIARIERRGGVTMRLLDKKRLGEEIALMCQLYEECWRENWAFVPMAREEVVKMSESLWPVLDEKLAFFLYVKGELAGAALLLPDVNTLLKGMDGKLGLISGINFLMKRSKIPGARVLLFGIRPAYRRLGVPLVLLNYLIQLAEERQHYTYVEAGWTLEDNEDINGLLEAFGSRRNKRYRIYRRDFLEA